MAQLAVYLAGLTAVAGVYMFLKRHPTWSLGTTGGPFGAPGWWRPLAVGWLVILVLFVAYASIANGFRWGMLLVFPILGGAFALGVVFLTVLGAPRRHD